MSTVPMEDDMPPLLDTEDQPQNHRLTNVGNSTSLRLPQQSHAEHNNMDDDDDDDEDECDDDDAVDVEIEMPEDDDHSEKTTCLFCSKVMANVDMAMQHLLDAHSVDFRQLRIKFDMDQYSFMKLINCIRAENIPACQLAVAKEPFWLDDKYLKAGAYEPWMLYDYETLPIELNTTSNDNKLYKELKRLHLREEEQIGLLKQAKLDMEAMRKVFHRLVEKTVIVDNNNIETLSSKTKTPETADSLTHCVALQSLHKDDSYFQSYAHFGIHHDMLSDKVRTSSYMNALLNNNAFVRDKDVLDVGCGTAILSIFASQAGARRVVGIDNSNIVYHAMDIVRQNNVSNVSLVKGRLEDTELPQNEYDIIVSEWMGYFLLYEGMLDSIIYARDHHLRPGGLLLPSRCTLSLVGYGSDELFQRHVNFWDNVYGLNMQNIKKGVLHEPLVEVVEPIYVLTKPNVMIDLDLATVDVNYANFSFNFELECTTAGNLSAFVGYFDTFFEGLPQPIHFGTGPHDPPTHWKQVIFFVPKPQLIQVGDIVRGTLKCERSKKDARSLDISIEAFGRQNKYYMD